MDSPAQPVAILRGHRAQVHAAAFIRSDSGNGSGNGRDMRLATGDSDGYIVLWDLAIMRPRAVWRAHENSLLGLAGWGNDQVVTHGRDHKLIVWRVAAADEAQLSTVLPLDAGTAPASAWPQPWVVHVLDVNSMNFCAFAWCATAAPAATTTVTDGSEHLVAVPHALALEAVDIFHLPSQRRVNTVRIGGKHGMVMALSLFYSHRDSTVLVLAVGFEDGAAVVATLADGIHGPFVVRYEAQPHSQPILSLAVTPDQSCFLTSAADAVIAKHPLPEISLVPASEPAIHAAPSVPEQAGGAAPGPGDKAIVSAHTTSPVRETKELPNPVSLLSAALAKERDSTKARAQAAAQPGPIAPQLEKARPLKTVNTKHAGQQGLCIRTDGRIFATGGWDARVRVYSAKTLKEVAVLKWHRTGCFAVAFAPVAVAAAAAAEGGQNARPEEEPASGQGNETTTVVQPHGSTREANVKERRIYRAITAHWLAAGSKDGKVSLWDIY